MISLATIAGIGAEAGVDLDRRTPILEGGTAVVTGSMWNGYSISTAALR